MKKGMWNFFKKNIVELLFVAGCIFAATGIGHLFRTIGFPETNIVLIYVFSVLMAARYTSGYFYGLLASVAAMLAFNYFFTEPYYTFKVNDYTYLITFAVMTMTSVFTSTLTSRVKKNALEAKLREKEAQALYGLTNYLTDAKSKEEITEIFLKSLNQIFGCFCGMLCLDENEKPDQSFLQYTEHGMIHRESRNAKELVAQMKYLKESFFEGEDAEEWPVYGQEGLLAILRIPLGERNCIPEGQKHLLISMIDCTAMAMDRLHSAKRQQLFQEESRQEHYRSNLLRSISHDLRTPLSGIMGTSEMICDMSKKGDPRYELAQGIWKDADWLHSLVENILNLTRLEDGRLTLHKQPEAVEELVESALDHIAKRAPEYEIDVRLPEEFIMVPVDAKLIVQVLVNLLDNAIKHTPPEKDIRITVWSEDEKVVFSVADCGTGILHEDFTHIFETFYTTQKTSADSQRGIGLGLAICEAIVRAHGGNIRAENRKGGGAEFIFCLPMEEEKNE